MAVQVSRSVEWRAGEGTPVKYSVDINGTIDLVNIRSSGGRRYGDVAVDLYITLHNHPYNSQNSFAAADFALLSIGDLNPRSNYPFDDGRSYYGEPLPAPSSLPTGSCVAEFRGDTLRPNPNKVSLWTLSEGYVINSEASEGSWTHRVNRTYTLELSGAHDQPILTWSSSGASPNHVEWLYQQVWYTAADFKHVLRYDANGGTGAPGIQEMAAEATQFTVSNVQPTRKHWVFLGWGDNPGDSSPRYYPGQTYPIFSELDKTIYAVWDYTYRPGMILKNGTWYSCDRDTDYQNGRYMTMLGRCHILKNGVWEEMRTRANKTGFDFSPNIRRNSSWPSQALIGNEGFPHDVGY